MSTFILFLDIANVKIPCFMFIVFIMRYTDSWISGDYMIVNS